MLIIRVNGEPAPQGSKTRNRAGAVYESSKAVGPWRDAVRTETQRAVAAADPDNPPYRAGEPVEVRMLFLLRRPKSHYRSGANAKLLTSSAPLRPVTPPDGDKLARAVFDGITAGGAIGDDKQIADHAVSKIYADPAEATGCLIYIAHATVSPMVGRADFRTEAEIIADADSALASAAAFIATGLVAADVAVSH